MTPVRFWLKPIFGESTVFALLRVPRWSMARAAVVLRCGHVVAHINDLAALGAAIDMLSRISPGVGVATDAALTAHEDAMRVAHSCGFVGQLGRVAEQLRASRIGAPSSEKRPVAWAAHPDVRLAADIAAKARAQSSLAFPFRRPSRGSSARTAIRSSRVWRRGFATLAMLWRRSSSSPPCISRWTIRAARKWRSGSSMWNRSSSCCWTSAPRRSTLRIGTRSSASVPSRILTRSAS